MMLGGPLSTVQDLAAMPYGGVVFASSDPAFGMFDADRKLALYRSSVTADMRDKLDGHFLSAPDAAGVWFGLEPRSTNPWLFDLTGPPLRKHPGGRSAMSSP